MYIFHFCANFDCSVTINGAPLGVLDSDTDSLHIRVMGLSKFLVSVFPINSPENKNLLPYAFNVKLDNGRISALSELATVTNFGVSNIEINLLPNVLENYEPPEVIKQTTLLSNILTTVYKDSHCRAMLENNKILLNHTMAENLSEAEISTISVNSKSYIKISGTTESGKNYALIIDTASYSVKTELIANKIEINGNLITTLNNCHDMARHAQVKKYKVEEAEKPFEEYVVYTEGSAVKTSTKELIPYAFFEAVQVKNFNLAREYLNWELKQELDDVHLNEFFGAFGDITYDKYSSDGENNVALIYGEKNKVAKIYRIIINNNLIENIEIV